MYTLLLTIYLKPYSIVQLFCVPLSKNKVTRNRTRDLHFNWASFSKFLVHVFTGFILIQHVQMSTTHVEFHHDQFDLESVKLPTCAPTSRSTTLCYRNLSLRLLSCNIRHKGYLVFFTPFSGYIDTTVLSVLLSSLVSTFLS